MKTLRWCGRHWGFLIFAIDVVGALLAVGYFQGIAGHFITFTEGARLLWAGKDPFGYSIPGGAGAYFYSIACAMFFYAPFAYLPARLGQTLYMGVSVLALALALRYFLSLMLKQFGVDWKTTPYRHLFWLMMGSELLGGIIATKLEVISVAALLFATGKFIEKKQVFRAALLLGMVTEWKFQPIPVVGLVFLAYFGWRPVLGFALGFLAMQASPYLFFPPETVTMLNAHRMASLTTYMADDWLRANIYQHWFRFVAQNFDLEMSLRTAQGISGGVAAIFAGWVFLASRMRSKAEGILLGLGLGCAFVAALSPMSQSNGYIFYTPLLFPVVVYSELSRARRSVVYGVMFLSYFLISLVYSDLVPRSLYHALYDKAVKPIGVTLLVGWLAARWYAVARPRLAKHKE